MTNSAFLGGKQSGSLHDGMLVPNRRPSIVGQGDCVACLAHDVDPRSLA